LRQARNLTQEGLAERAGLSTDTIRKLESGRLSPTITTVRKLCAGLDLSLATFFASHETDRRDEIAELGDFLRTRSPREQRRACRVIRALFEDG